MPDDETDAEEPLLLSPLPSMRRKKLPMLRGARKITECLGAVSSVNSSDPDAPSRVMMEKAWTADCISSRSKRRCSGCGILQDSMALVLVVVSRREWRVWV